MTPVVPTWHPHTDIVEARAVLGAECAHLDDTYRGRMARRSAREPDMVLSIKTDEADRLARTLAKLMGETMTEAVTTALRERLARKRPKREAAAGLPARIAAFSQLIDQAYDTLPVTKAE